MKHWIAVLMAAALISGCKAGQSPRETADAGVVGPRPTDVQRASGPAVGSNEEWLGFMSTLSGGDISGLVADHIILMWPAIGESPAPSSFQQLNRYVPFNSLRDAFELTYSRNQELGYTLLVGERPLSSDNPFSAKLRAMQVQGTIPKYEGFDPPPGVHGDVERWIAIVSPHEPHWSDLKYQQSQTEAWSSKLTSSQNSDAPLPEPTTANAKLVLMVNIINACVTEIVRSSPDHRAPTSLQHLALIYGGLNPACWINPYTGAPMKNVPISQPTPGDYSDLSTGEGTWIGFHYVNVQGQTATRYCGHLGEYEPGSMLPAIAPTGDSELGAQPSSSTTH
ncbi:MAG: hypothetical protein GEEBNDBF_01378 [bacterium]|nr:hypothetical protein [bacterium]